MKKTTIKNNSKSLQNIQALNITQLMQIKGGLRGVDKNAIKRGMIIEHVIIDLIY